MERQYTWIYYLRKLKELRDLDIFPCLVYTTNPPADKNELDNALKGINDMAFYSFYEYCNGAYLADLNFYGISYKEKNIFERTSFYKNAYTEFAGENYLQNKIVFATDSASKPYIYDKKKQDISTYFYDTNKWIQISPNFNDFMNAIFFIGGIFSSDLWDETLLQIQEVMGSSSKK